MLNQFSRTQLLLSPEGMEKLAASRVAVFGIGGVGALDLIDDDRVCLTNLNRQIIVTRRTVGQYKADAMRERILEINPDAKVQVHRCFFLLENADEFSFEKYDYIVDAVDTVTAKIALILTAKEKGVPVISCMGRETSWMRQRFVSRTSTRRACARWHGSCAGSCASAAWIG